jgi:raffinose/stachyose/melibiose transport system permease protein
MVVPFVVIVLVWQFIYDPNYGLLNALLTMVGLKGLTNTWLGNPDLALYCIAGVGFPWISGFNLLVYLAGLQNIPQEVLDASLIDGAGRWRRFRSVHLPLILGQVKLLLILSIINTLQGFVTVYILTQGGPADATTVPGLEMYVQAFQYSKFGFGMALGTLIFLVILALTYLNMRYIRPSLEYQA